MRIDVSSRASSSESSRPSRRLLRAAKPSSSIKRSTSSPQSPRPKQSSTPPSTTNCTTTHSNDGQNLAITYVTLPPQTGLTGCDQSFAFEEIESNATQTLNFDYVIVRCGNNLSWLRYSIGGASQQQARVSLLATILTTGLPAIEAMPRN